jgi:hypothetical protein
MTGRFAAFRYRDFRLFWIGLFLSNTGTWMQMTAVNDTGQAPRARDEHLSIGQ